MKPTEPTAAQESLRWSAENGTIWSRKEAVGFGHDPQHAAAIAEAHNAAVAKLEARYKRACGLLERSTPMVNSMGFKTLAAALRAILSGE